MFFSKPVQSTRFRSFFRFLATPVLLLSLFGNDLTLALPQARLTPEPVPGPDSPLSMALSAVGEPELSPAPGLPTTPIITDTRALPANVAGLPELVDQRTADSATFEVGEDRYVTILDAGALHYKDSQGAWQIIDPTFHPTENGFIVEHNSIRSRAGLSAARLSAAVGKTIIIWQATALGAVADSGEHSQFVPLAEALAEPSNFAEKQEDGRVLHYAGNWSDPSLAEEIVSGPDSLEHLLTLSEPPQADGSPDFLEMRATLKLLPGAELWADGQPQSDAFQTASSLEIRNAEGDVALVFDPILAFEQNRPSIAVSGVYVARPIGEPGAWTIGLRTPWRWWTDSARRYPAVIDPTMHVLQPTGYGDGIAWVGDGYSGNPDTSDRALKFGEMVLGSWFASGQYNGYVQFNSIPFMLTNAPISVTAAYLDIEPSHVRMPYYYCKAKKGTCIDWDMLPTQHNATLYDLGQCPGDCGGFSLVSEPVGFDWNNVPQGTTLGAKPLVGPALVGSGATTITSWDVTNSVRAWNQQSPRPDDGPAFRLTVHTNCPSNYFEGVSEHLNVPACTRLVVPAGGARLQIEYTELKIAVGENFLNSHGVPSFYEGVFEDTNHQYDLAIPVGDYHWRAVAVRGNHAIEEALPTRTGLKLLDYSASDSVELVNGTVQEADKTTFALIDEHNPDNNIEVADLRAEVTASNENDFSTDEGRNYRIEHQQATAWTVGYSAWITKVISFRTDRLIELGEFDLATGDSVIIRVTAPVTFPLELGLAAPTSGADKANSALGNVNLDKGFGPEGYLVRSKDFPYVHTAGTWALAMVNQGRPVPNPIRPQYGIAHQVTVEILRCPEGTIATAKWLCQPVILPDAFTPRATGLGLTVYSEGGFTDDPTGDTWCTTKEGNGTPIIGPDVNGRWVVVGQGSVCRNGDTISTTVESGIGLAVVNPNLNPAPDGTTRGKILPAFIYGSVAFYPLPDGYPTGVVVRSGDSGQLAPQEDARRNIAPFEEYWDTVFTADPDFISTTEMKAHGGGTIDAAVTVDAASGPENLSWDVPWTLYPEETAQYDYIFDVQPDQSSALASPTLLASLQLRILDTGNVATGLVESLDYYKFESNVDAGQFRADKAKVTQDEKLGGATKNAQVVIQPPGMARLPANQKSCSHDSEPTSCLDLRRDDYAWDNGSGDKNVQPWELPDIHIEDSAGTMMFSRPGELQIFSADHPHARLADMEQSFSFDTWGATVNVKEEPCTEGGPVVTVVRGSASIALPSIGDDGSGGAAGITVNFKLCQAELRQAQLILEIPPPGIPVGSTGVGVNLIGGKVTIDPDFTQIELQLGFQTLDGATLTDGMGTVLIDTRGLFQLQASATIVGFFDAELLLQVAWNPLDILLEAGVSCCGGLISGHLRMHAWIGQGWQHKYSWLPNNQDFHFSGSVQATLKIPEGYIADLGFMELPPFDFSIGIKIAFGEFCTNSSCTSYDWGMSGTLTICGFDIGLYVDSSGPELILGTDDHVLIDQFGGSSQQSMAKANSVAAPAPPPYQITQPGSWQRFLVKLIQTPVDDWPIESASSYGCTGAGTPVHTCPFTVSAGAGRALFTVGWENGDLDVALIKPNDTVVTPTNAMTHSIVVSQTSSLLAHQISFGVPETAIMSGTWQLQLSNVITDPLDPFQTNYQILFATEPPPPTLTWNSPVVTGTTPDGGGIVTLDWTALRGGQPLTSGTRIELFYVPVASKPVTPTLITGTLIANQIAANQGTYAWDTNGLASGEYAVGGRIDDHFKANGHIVAWAPGTVVISDTTPPPVPNILGEVDLKDALIVIWERDNTTPDLAGYLVEHTIPDWDETASQLPRVRRMLPNSPSQWPWFERIRLGGLLSGQPVTVCVRAYDASGNVSACESFIHTVALDPRPTLGAPRRLRASCRRNPLTGQTELQVDWQPPDPSTGTPAGYALGYNLAGCVVPGASSLADQGPSPIDVGNVLAYALTGLTVGQTYRIGVSGYTDDGYVGPQTSAYVLCVDPTDANGDGLPDQWAELYGLTGGPDDDPDGDGVTNEGEYSIKSNPLHADSDGDGYYDSEEAEWGTDVCGSEHPPYHAGPKLTLVGMSTLEFTAASNQSGVSSQEILLFNFGGGTLDWSASASEPWITLGSESGSGMFSLPISVDLTGLTTGHYTGTVTIRSLSTLTRTIHSQAAAAQEAATIDVKLDVLPPKDFSCIFLPLILKQASTWSSS